MAQESERARGTTISTGLKNCKKIADFGPRKSDVAGNSIEGSAEGSHYVDNFFGERIKFVGERDRIVSLDRLSQIAGGGQMVIHAAIKNQELLTARDFDVADASQID